MTGNRLFSIGVLLVCAVFYLATFEFAVDGADEGAVSRDDPATFPRFILMVTGALAAINLAASFFAKKPDEKIRLKGLWAKYGNAVIILGLFSAYLLLLPRAGFIASSLLFLFTAQWVLRGLKTRKDILANITVTVTATFAVYFVFTEFLTILLP